MKKIFIALVFWMMFFGCNKVKTNDIVGNWYSVTNLAQSWDSSYLFSDITFTKNPKKYETTLRDNFGATIRDIKASWKWANNRNSIVFDLEGTNYGGQHLPHGLELELIKLTSDSLWLVDSNGIRFLFYR